MTGPVEQHVKHVIVEATGTGNFLDPTAYLDLLPTSAGALPPGAREFATDPDHYDFYSQRCVKDLKPDALLRGETAGERWLQLGFRHNCWKHEEDLTIRYVGVSSFSLDTTNRSDWTGRRVRWTATRSPRPWPGARAVL
ncbi:hypothetical protein [Saccharothrix deserti]|uniref:hypothetical protein n=1 Tax=Saccharothrix deserti TaxID=2593674 RepID=UPI00131CCCAA|nr:hypothetical protein [Saccharothrix deserti]